MGVLRAIGLAFLGFIALLMIITIVAILMSRLGTPTQATNTTQVVNITNEPAGIYYNGPQTTALAGYYCIYNATVASDGWIENSTYTPNPNAYHPPGFMVQLNALLSNGLSLQNVYGGIQEGGSILLEWAVLNTHTHPWQFLSLTTGPPASNCGWLVIKVVNGTAYFGYSQDGRSIDWYASYPVGSSEIAPGTVTNLVITGPGNSAGVEFKSLYAVLALWYWNGTAWVPAPTGVAGIYHWYGIYGTLEFVAHAWVYNYNNTAVVTWPEPVNKSVPVPTPEFKP